MLRLPVALAALALSAGMAALPVSATPLSGSPLPILQTPSASNVELVGNKNGRPHKWVYNRNRHGPRYAYRHGPYRYHYGGWWYARPWWGVGPGYAVEPGYGYGYAYGDPGYEGDPGYAQGDPDGGYGGDQGYADGGGGDPHVQWCMNRYRSYDPQSDSFMGYDGQPHRCLGPY
jgi:hypothetical protein